MEQQKVKGKWQKGSKIKKKSKSRAIIIQPSVQRQLSKETEKWGGQALSADGSNAGQSSR